jgi:hypothetical protein
MKWSTAHLLFALLAIALLTIAASQLFATFTFAVQKALGGQ